MQRSSESIGHGSLPVVLVALASAVSASFACTKYTVAPFDGGNDHAASGGSDGATMPGIGGAAASGTKLDGSVGLGGTAGAGTGGRGLGETGGGLGSIGGSAGAAMAVDASTKDELGDVRDTAADLPVDTAAPLLANGATCQKGSACQSGKCVDSFCCDSDCTGQCQSCGESTSPGKCVTISGNVRGQIRPTCTGSGICAATCNGTDPAQCHFPGSEKPCATASCTAGVAKAAASCDGNGMCPAGAMSNCDPFICGTSACKTTCTTSADCNASSYCAAPNCVAKKGLGSVCSAYEQCTTAICGGRCCSASCTCPQQSTANILTNAGFDSNLIGWSNPAVASQWTSQDVDGCPFSGAIQVVGGGLGLTQCVAVTPGAAYTFSGWFRNPDGLGYVVSFLGLADANCSVLSDPVITTGFGGTETTWTFRSTTVEIPANGNHLRIEIDTNPNLFADKLSLSPNGAF